MTLIVTNIYLITSRTRSILFCFIIKIFLQVKEKEKQTLEKIQNARTKIRNEIRELKDRLKLAQENMQLVKEKVDAEELLVEEAL